MTFQEIISRLTQDSCAALVASFNEAVEAEAAALKRGVGGVSAAARDAARDFYAHDISELLEAASIPALTPNDVVFNRRKPMVWAIATILREQDAPSRAYRTANGYGGTM